MAERTLDEIVAALMRDLRNDEDARREFNSGYRTALLNVQSQMPKARPAPAPLDVPVCPVKGCGRDPLVYRAENGVITVGCDENGHPDASVGTFALATLVHHWRTAVAAWRRDRPEETTDA